MPGKCHQYMPEMSKKTLKKHWLHLYLLNFLTFVCIMTCSGTFILDMVCSNASDVLMDQSDCRFTCYPTLTYTGSDRIRIKAGGMGAVVVQNGK